MSETIDVPVLIGFDVGTVIGKAQLSRDEERDILNINMQIVSSAEVLEELLKDEILAVSFIIARAGAGGKFLKDQMEKEAPDGEAP